MTEQEHSEIMNNIMKQLDKDSLNLGDGLAIWHSLGVFLFSNLDKENKDISVVYANMREYLNELETTQLHKKGQQ
jgi:hypothetical protein